MRLLPKVLLAVVVPVTIGAGAVLLVLSGSWQRTLENELVDSARRALVTRIDTVPAGLQAARETLRLLAGTPALHGDDLAAIRATLREWSRQNGLFEDFYFVKPGGQAYPPDGEALALHDRDFFPAFLRGEEVAGQVAISPLTQQPAMLYLVPLFDADGRLVGGLGGSIILHALFERTVSVDNGPAGERFMLLDSGGRLLAGGLDGSPPLLQAPTAERAPQTAAVAAAVRAAVAADEIRPDLRLAVGDEMLRVLHAPVPALSWRLVYAQPESAMLAPLADARRLAGIVVAAASAAALALAALLYRLIVRPVRLLAEAQGRLQRGLRETRAPVAGDDEFAELAASFNRMADSLQATESRFRVVFAAAPYAMTLSRLRDGALLDVNPAFERLTGYAHDEAVGRNTLQLGIAAEPAALRAQTAQLRAGGSLDNVEMRGIDRRGRNFWALYSSRLIEHGGERLVVTMSVDITPQKQAEAARRESEAGFTALFEMAPMPLSVVDESDGFHRTHWNEAWYQTFGYARAEAENRSGNDIGLWVSPAERTAYISAATTEGDVSTREVQMRRRDGAVRQVEVFGRMIRIGERRQLMTIYVDVTDARRAESELRAREVRLRSLFEMSPVAVLVLDLQGRIVEANRRFPEMLQREAGEVLGRSYFEFVPPDELEAAHQRVARMLEQASREVFSTERSFLRRDGSTVTGLLSARRLPRGDGGEDILLVVISDLSELRHAEAQRLASETKLQTVFNATPTAMIVSDAARNYAAVAVNDAWERQFRRSRAQVMGLTGAEMGLWDSAEDRRRVLEAVERDGSVAGFETMLVRGDGVRLRCRIAARQVRAGDGDLLVMVQEDVTELRRAEAALHELNEALDARVRERTEELARINEELSGTLEALRCTQGDLVRSEKLAALGSLVAGVAHELNTPIGNSVTVASTLVELSEQFAGDMAGGLRRSVLQAYVDNSRRAAELLLANLQRAANLVTSFKQVAVDQTSEQRRGFEVAEVVDEILAMLSPQLRKRPLDVREAIPAGLRLDSYPGPFGQVVANLVNNAAIHAFDDGGRRGTIEIVAEAVGEDAVRLTIADDGAGIAPEHLDRIFDPFFTTRLGKGGSGLGLHIVYNIVGGVLGGSIRVDSEPGRGTRFTLELPRVAPVPQTPE